MQDLPHKLDAEQAVLGGIMLDDSALPKLADWIKPEDFYTPAHRLIYQAMLDSAAQGNPLDAVTLGEWFASNGKLSVIDDGAYLVELAMTTPSAANVVAYAEIVKAKSTQRRGIQIGTELAERFRNPKGMDVPQIAAAATVELSELTNVKRGGFADAKDICKQFYETLCSRFEREGETVGYPTPWKEYNDQIGGWEDSKLYFLAGRPGMGKSAAVVVAAVEMAIARPDKIILVHSIEMPAGETMERMIAHVAGVELDFLRNPRKPCYDSDLLMPRVASAIKAINGTRLKIDETGSLSIGQLVSRARREAMRGDVRAVFVDHIHRMEFDEQNEVSEMNKIAKALKNLAKELSCPVIALAQLNRGVESRQDKRPMMSDLRGSGGLEQEADAITMIYRDEYYYKEQSQQKGNVEFNTEKLRSGKTGRINLKSNLAYGGIIDYERGAPSFDAPVKPEYGGF